MSRPSPQPAHLTRGYALATLSAVFLSLTGILIRHLTLNYAMPALILAFWRALFTALVLLLALAVLRPRLLRAGRKNLAYLAGYGVLLALFNSLWTTSVAVNGAAVATVLAYSSAAFTALLGRWLLKESLGWVKITAVLLSLAGCVLVSGALDPAAWAANLLGISAGVLAGLAYAIYSLLGRRAAQRGINPWTTLLYTFSVASLTLAVFNLFPGGPLPGSAARPAEFMWLGQEWAGWGALLLLAAGPTVAGFGFYNLSLVDLPSSVANLIATMEPVFTSITAYFLFGERLTPVQILGSALILGGVVFLRTAERYRSQPAALSAQLTEE